MSNVSDPEKVDHEREKPSAEIEVRARQMSRESDAANSKWRSPLVVAVLAAAAAAGGSAVVAVVNGAQQVALEESRAESARILEMIKTSDPDKAATNLDFLLAAGLITNPDRTKRLREYLKARDDGGGPSLPAAGGIELSEQQRTVLNKLLRDYQSHHEKLGFAPPPPVVFRLNAEGYWPISYYRPPDTIVVDPRMAPDHSVFLREYNHHVLLTKISGWKGHIAAIESGMADYLGCSFLNNSKFGEVAAKVINPLYPYARELSAEADYVAFLDRVGAVSTADVLFEGAKVWGALFWAMRTELGPTRSDQIVAKAWRDVTWPNNEADRPLAFTAALISTAGSDAEAVRTILKRRNFPVS